MQTGKITKLKMPIAETPGGGPKTAKVNAFPKELEKRKVEIRLESKPGLARLSKIVPRIAEPAEPKHKDMPADEEIGLEEDNYLTWVESELEGQDPLKAEKRKILAKIKADKNMTDEERNQLLDDLIRAEDEDKVKNLISKG